MLVIYNERNTAQGAGNDKAPDSTGLEGRDRLFSIQNT